MLPSVGGHIVGRDLGGQNTRAQDQLNSKRHLKCKKLGLAAREGLEVGWYVCSQLKEVSNDEEEQGQG